MTLLTTTSRAHPRSRTKRDAAATAAGKNGSEENRRPRERWQGG
jgi:hypothetical protein